MGWLLPRIEPIRRLARHDQKVRNLQGETNKRAMNTLLDKDEEIYHWIEFVLLKKSLYLYHYSKKHTNLTEHSRTFTGLVGEATQILTSDRLDKHVQEYLHITDDILAQYGWVDLGPQTITLSWLEIVIRHCAGLAGEPAKRLLEATQPYYEKLCVRMATHLQITADQIDRTRPIPQTTALPISQLFPFDPTFTHSRPLYTTQTNYAICYRMHLQYKCTDEFYKFNASYTIPYIRLYCTYLY